jgi:hypothetical protein
MGQIDLSFRTPTTWTVLRELPMQNYMHLHCRSVAKYYRFRLPKPFLVRVHVAQAMEAAILSHYRD